MVTTERGSDNAVGACNLSTTTFTLLASTSSLAAAAAAEEEEEEVGAFLLRALLPDESLSREESFEGRRLLVHHRQRMKTVTNITTAPAPMPITAHSFSPKMFVVCVSCLRTWFIPISLTLLLASRNVAAVNSQNYYRQQTSISLFISVSVSVSLSENQNTLGIKSLLSWMLPRTFSAAPLTRSMLKYFRISRNHQQKQQQQQQQKKETIKALPTSLPTLVLASSAQNIGRFKLPTPNLGLMRPRVTRRK